ncbi:MAG TPA: methyltransferase domain-containing protein [Tepidisphaeraceae bacterium]|jgi:2-polyprenyl-3-methyl-5-hydroxy-6-metoxy-1,4-benzoquinol methylase|nr:methyltransferase domain-containing protein [Tepidisphaeraceae bacterium]
MTPEIMDDPGIDPSAHAQALAGLRRINRVSHTARRMADPIWECARAHRLTTISHLDIACGGGDVPIGIAEELRRRGTSVELTLLDRSATAVTQAKSAAREAQIGCRGVVADAGGEIARLFQPGSFDVVTNSLFLHHLPDSAAVIRLLSGMRQLARRLVVISDLRRSRDGYLAAWLGCRVLSRSRIVHHDGPVSVQAAWSSEELRSFAVQAGMKDAAIAHCRPWRMMLVGRPS